MDKVPTFLIYEEIGVEGITAKDVADFLDQNKGVEVLFRIDSAGGSISQGLAIGSLMKNHGKVNVMIDGVAASIASVICCFAQKVSMAENAFLFVHCPLVAGYIEANAEQLRKIAKDLDINEGVIQSIYQKKCGKNITAEKLQELMKAESYITAIDALDYGFVDEMTGEISLSMVNRHKGVLTLLNTGPMSEIVNEEVKAEEVPAVETPKEEVKALSLEDVMAFLVELKASVDAMKATLEDMKKEAPAPEAKIVEEVKAPEPIAKKVPNMKAFKPEVTETPEKSILEMSPMERAKFIQKKLK